MIFLNSASSAVALVLYLPGVCTLTPKENRERPESRIFSKIRKKTQYLMNTLYLLRTGGGGAGFLKPVNATPVRLLSSLSKNNIKDIKKN